MLMAACCVAAHANEVWGVGIKKLVLLDPMGQAPVPVVAFYPSSDRTASTKVGPYEIAATQAAAIGLGQYPLILISHGNAAGMWSHHDTATYLAARGYIVVSLTHPGDNFQDASRMGAVSSIYGRVMQISAALDAVQHDDLLSSHIDRKRVGFMGFSAGGATGLMLAGAKPEWGRLVSYCTQNHQHGAICEARGQIRMDQPHVVAPSADPRITAYVLIAPLGAWFSREELQKIRLPMQIYVGDQDSVLSPQDNAIYVANSLTTMTELSVLTGVGHFTFLAPCSRELQRSQPRLCTDGANVDRVALHQKINAEIAAFFFKTQAAKTKEK